MESASWKPGTIPLHLSPLTPNPGGLGLLLLPWLSFAEPLCPRATFLARLSFEFTFYLDLPTFAPRHEFRQPQGPGQQPDGL